MRTKEQFLEALKQNELFAKAIASVKTDAERQKIAAVTEAFVAQFASVLGPIISAAQDNPEYADKLRQSLVTPTEVVTSGSVG